LSFYGDDHNFLRTAKRPPAPSGPIIRVVDLFSGCGGLSLGLQEACRALGRGFEVPLAVDADPVAADCYAANFPGAKVRKQDVCDIFDGRLDASLTLAERKTRKELGGIDFLIGGPPCQGHSDLNNYTRRSDPKNGLYTVMARAARVLEPKHVLIENVPGSMHDAKGAVQRTASDLAAQGYSISYTTVSLDRIGVPQRRRRLILIATRADVKAESLFTRHELPVRSLSWAIGDLVNVERRTIFDQPSTPSPDNAKRIAYLFKHDLDDLPDAQRPPCHRDGRHSYKSVYGRMSWDEPAQTVTSGFYSMCMGRYVHPSQRRTITAHEAARLQFFPDYFDFSRVPVRTALARIIANAVPMKLSYLAAIELLNDCHA
jgi:DNA (cytosine-5)-methyltransferase 1